MMPLQHATCRIEVMVVMKAKECERLTPPKCAAWRGQELVSAVRRDEILIFWIPRKTPRSILRRCKISFPKEIVYLSEMTRRKVARRKEELNKLGILPRQVLCYANAR